MGGAVGTGLFLGSAQVIQSAGPSIILGYAIVVAMTELTAVAKYVHYWWPHIPAWVSALFFFVIVTAGADSTATVANLWQHGGFFPHEALSHLMYLAVAALYTKNTITDLNLLESEIQRIGVTNLGTDNEEFIAGMVACSVPILHPNGEIIACLYTHAPTSDLEYPSL
ncbi:unnamed protein product [Oppiella nova]|uniref:IclR-ED domain-containing protein n=1 Tax=Oppiella nova TaxID=334625 RepID=A0A7R9QAW7_9ACAR|nr:unnamed protein product [Oppiella nova]CAG2160375.1 unnamed protein product [Oppiella nova]